MAQTMVNSRMDEDLKKGMEQFSKEMGLSMTADPFYSEVNMERLRKAVADAKAGKLTEHELIGVGDD